MLFCFWQSWIPLKQTKWPLSVLRWTFASHIWICYDYNVTVLLCILTSYMNASSLVSAKCRCGLVWQLFSLTHRTRLKQSKRWEMDWNDIVSFSAAVLLSKCSNGVSSLPTLLFSLFLLLISPTPQTRLVHMHEIMKATCLNDSFTLSLCCFNFPTLWNIPWKQDLSVILDRVSNLNDGRAFNWGLSASEPSYFSVFSLPVHE